jgi:hypothetical protein
MSTFLKNKTASPQSVMQQGCEGLISFAGIKGRDTPEVFIVTGLNETDEELTPEGCNYQKFV